MSLPLPVAQAAASELVSAWRMIVHGTISTQLILIILLVFSLFSWGLIVWKALLFRKLWRQAGKFMERIEIADIDMIEVLAMAVPQVPQRPPVVIEDRKELNNAFFSGRCDVDPFQTYRGLRLLNPSTGQAGTISGVPAVAYGGQGGLGDVILHPQYAGNRRIYLSYIERSGAIYGAVVVHARLELDSSGGGHLSQLTRVWEQAPKVSGQGHFSHRLAFDAAGKLWITSGDRQKFDPAQDMGTNLGKLIRLNDDGSVPSDNPFFGQGGVAAQVWSLGHRNPLGIAFDAQGRLWVHEMGPEGGDELNLILRGRNYGWPLVSNGNHYGGDPIPDHSTRPDLEAPKAWWTPVIAPSGMIIYSGDLFRTFRGHAFIGGLASQALVRVRFDGTRAAEHRRYPMGQRIREVEQGPDGAIYLLEDGSGGRLLRLTPPG